MHLLDGPELFIQHVVCFFKTAYLVFSTVEWLWQGSKFLGYNCKVFFFFIFLNYSVLRRKEKDLGSFPILILLYIIFQAEECNCIQIIPKCSWSFKAGWYSLCIKLLRLGHFREIFAFMKLCACVCLAGGPNWAFVFHIVEVTRCFIRQMCFILTWCTWYWFSASDF